MRDKRTPKDVFGEAALLSFKCLPLNLTQTSRSVRSSSTLKPPPKKADGNEDFRNRFEHPSEKSDSEYYNYIDYIFTHYLFSYTVFIRLTALG